MKASFAWFWGRCLREFWTGVLGQIRAIAFLVALGVAIFLRYVPPESTKAWSDLVSFWVLWLTIAAILLTFFVVCPWKVYQRGVGEQKRNEESLPGSAHEQKIEAAIAECDRLMVQLREARNRQQFSAVRKGLSEFLTAQSAVNVWRDVNDKIARMDDDNFYKASNATAFLERSVGEALSILRPFYSELLARRRK